MAEVFLCYAPEDRLWAKSLAQVLTTAGFEVLWDLSPSLGKTTAIDVDAELGSAKSIIAIWSLASRGSNWVRDIAQEALDRGVLLPVLRNVERPPLGFRQVRSADLTTWEGRNARGLEELIGDLRSRIGQSTEAEIEFERSTIVMRSRAEEASASIAQPSQAAPSIAPSAVTGPSGSAKLVTAVAPRRGGPGDLKTGDEVGQYRIVRRLGAGGFGAVYEAANIHNEDERVALKMLLAEVAASERFAQLLKLEANALLRLKHPAVVQYRVFGRIADSEQFYLVTEFVPGPTLRDWRKANTPTLNDLRMLATRLAEGLGAAHRRGIVHRDLAPDNVIVTSGDLSEATLIDFGIARLGDGDVLSSAFAGKFSYAAPEQFEFDTLRLGPAIDIYSFGLLMAAFMRGRPIDMGRDMESAKAKRAAVPPLDDMPAPLRPILTRLLQPEPNDRPRSMDEVAKLFAAMPEEIESVEPAPIFLEANSDEPFLPAPSGDPEPPVADGRTAIVLRDDDREHLSLSAAAEPALPRPENLHEFGPAIEDASPPDLGYPSVDRTVFQRAIEAEPPLDESEIPDAGDESGRIDESDASAKLADAPAADDWTDGLGGVPSGNVEQIEAIEPARHEPSEPIPAETGTSADAGVDLTDPLTDEEAVPPVERSDPIKASSSGPGTQEESGPIVVSNPLGDEDALPVARVQDPIDLRDPPAELTPELNIDAKGSVADVPLETELKASSEPPSVIRPIGPDPLPATENPISVADTPGQRPHPRVDEPARAGMGDWRERSFEETFDDRGNPLVDILADGPKTTDKPLAGLALKDDHASAPQPTDDDPEQGGRRKSRARSVSELIAIALLGAGLVYLFWPHPQPLLPPVVQTEPQPVIPEAQQPPTPSPPAQPDAQTQPDAPPSQMPPSEPQTPPQPQPKPDLEPEPLPPIPTIPEAPPKTPEPPPQPPKTEPPVSNPPPTNLPETKPSAEPVKASGRVEPAPRGTKPQKTTGHSYGDENTTARIVYIARSPAKLTVSAANKTIFDKQLARGDSYRLPDRRDLAVSVSDAGALDVILDGKFIGRAGPDGAVLNDFAVTPVAYGGPDKIAPQPPVQPPQQLPAEPPKTPPPQQEPPKTPPAGSGNLAADALSALNAVRTGSGLRAVKMSAALNNIAATIAQFNAGRGVAGGVNPSQVLKMLVDAGYGNARAGQAHARNQKTPADAIAFWRTRGDTEPFLMDPNMVAMGFAAAKAADGKVYYTMIIAYPPQ